MRFIPILLLSLLIGGCATTVQCPCEKCPVQKTERASKDDVKKRPRPVPLEVRKWD